MVVEFGKQGTNTPPAPGELVIPKPADRRNLTNTRGVQNRRVKTVKIKPLPKLPKDICDGIPIVGLTGINGAGKTLVAVESAIIDMSHGREVYSTVPIFSPWGNSKPILSLRQLLTLKNVTILLDEVSVIFSSTTATSALPGEIVTLLQTLRHSGCTVRWTAPSWMRANTLLRDVTQGLVNVTPALKVHDGSPWPRPRLVFAGLMDTSVGKKDADPTRVMRRRIYVPRKLAAWGAYDTMADTPMLGRKHKGGTCIDCDGSMERPKHNKARHEHLGLPWYDDEAAVA